MADDRPSSRIALEAMEPVLEETSRTANRIREELGLPTRRYELYGIDAAEIVMSSELLENVRVAVLHAIARPEGDPSLSFQVCDSGSMRLVCWAVAGNLYAPETARQATVEDVVRAERSSV